MFRQFHWARRKNQHAYVTSLSGQLVIPALRPPEVCSTEFIRRGQSRFRRRSTPKEKRRGWARSRAFIGSELTTLVVWMCVLLKTRFKNREDWQAPRGKTNERKEQAANMNCEQQRWWLQTLVVDARRSRYHRDLSCPLQNSSNDAQGLQCFECSGAVATGAEGFLPLLP